MTDSTRLPAPLASWVETVPGPLKAVQDAFRARENSQMREVTGRAGDYNVKVALKPALYTRETRAYREAVPHLGHAPALKDSSADLLALFLTAVDGEPLKGEEPPARRRAAHRQTGPVLRRFHEAPPGHQAQDQAAHHVESAQSGLDKHIAQAGDHLSTAESDTLRRLVSTLPGLGPLPAGWRHGNFRERNLLWNGRCCAVIDFQRSEPGPLVSDFVKLTTSLGPDHPELRTALFERYGRSPADAEESALAAFAAAEPAGALVYGPRHGDAFVTARDRRAVERPMQEGRR
ncbi:aminoglycoside phosphotransferase family protein [Streptomyces sp. NPDC005728]|uniref:aminoglycoside phosphotransferase family protein n=1 Tax=Streptomyces sp. NPDC005728 TaxID=3157054 RepID=UPI0033E4F468